MDVETFQRLGLHQSWEDLHPREHLINGRSNVEIDAVLRTHADQQYHPCAEAYLVEPLKGSIQVFNDWHESSVYAATRRKLAVYLPPKDQITSALDLLVCNDGEGYRYNKGAVRAPAVLENLCAADGALRNEKGAHLHWEMHFDDTSGRYFLGQNIPSQYLQSNIELLFDQ
mgnify:CR=1 FL=1